MTGRIPAGHPPAHFHLVRRLSIETQIQQQNLEPSPPPPPLNSPPETPLPLLHASPPPSSPETPHDLFITIAVHNLIVTPGPNPMSLSPSLKDNQNG